MNPSLRIWAVRKCYKNLWRMPPGVDLDDMLQIAELVYHRLTIRYRDRIDFSDTRTVTNYFKRALSNELSDMDSRKQREVPVVDIDKGDGSNPIEDLNVYREPDVEMAVAEAPEDIRLILRVLIDEGDMVLGHALRRRKDGSVDTVNERLRRKIARISPATKLPRDILAHLKTYLRKGRT